MSRNPHEGKRETPADECRRHQRSIRPASYVQFCGRCGHATGGGYGHFTAWCKVENRFTDDHFCCPGSCELRDGPDIDPSAPCHPAPEDYPRWIAETDAVREQRRH